jgi:hypothetical protein
VHVEHHLHVPRPGQERHRNVVEHASEGGRRQEVDLLEERQLLVYAVDAVLLQVRVAEREADAGHRVEDAVLGGQRLDRDRVHVLRVDDRACQVQVGLQPDGHAGQVLAEHGGHRGLPRHLHLEGHLDLRACPDEFLARELHVLEGQVDGLAVVPLLDPGQQGHRQRLDLLVDLATDEDDLTVQRAAGAHVPVEDAGVHRRAALAEAGHHLLEHAPHPASR